MEACNVTLPTPVLFSIFLYFGVIIANSQLPGYTKSASNYTKLRTAKIIYGLALPQTPLMKLTTLTRLPSYLG